MRFDIFLQKRLFKPLGMKSTSYWLTPAEARRLARVHWMKDGKITPWDDAHGRPGEAWNSINKEVGERRQTPGSVGLVGTAEDYWLFAQMIVNGGELNGVRILSPQVIRYMTRDHLGSLDLTMGGGLGFGLGFGVIEDAVAAGFMNSEGSIFWDGAAATLWWADPHEDLVVVAMTQFLDLSEPTQEVLRPQLRALVYGALLQ